MLGLTTPVVPTPRPQPAEGKALNLLVSHHITSTLTRTQVMSSLAMKLGALTSDDHQ